MLLRIVAVFFILSIYTTAFATIELPSILGSNMVLPKETKVRLWGWASPSEKIKVTTSWDGRTDSVTTNRDGKWQLWVQSPAAGGPHSITFAGSNTIRLENILSGAVWVCTGQSNMEWNWYNGVDSMQPELAKGVQPAIRFFQIARKTAAHPQEDVRGQWVVCDSNTLKSFSAVGYFFGQQLNNQLKIPVGLINASWGGTPAEVWMPDSIVRSNEAWQKDAARQNQTPWWTITPGAAYNAMLAPITPFAIDGAIWYQGEANVGTANNYGALLTALIGAWRKQWGKELPFYLVQIAPFTYGPHYGAALLREKQADVAKNVAKTGMVVVSDLVADTTNIHPTNKKDVGYRLARMALADVYGQPLKGTRSIAYEHAEIKGNKMLLYFKNEDSKLMMKGKKPTALLIAGADGVFYPAEAKIVGSNTLEVWSSKVAKPAAVRYQFSSAGIGNLAGGNCLPVAPFRTDDWSL